MTGARRAVMPVLLALLEAAAGLTGGNFRVEVHDVVTNDEHAIRKNA